MFSVAFIHTHVPKYWFYLKLFIPKRSGLFLKTHRVVTKTNRRWLLSFSRKLFWQDYSVFWLKDYVHFLIVSRPLTPLVTHVFSHIKRPSFPLTFCWIIPLPHQILLHLHSSSIPSIFTVSLERGPPMALDSNCCQLSSFGSELSPEQFILDTYLFPETQAFPPCTPPFCHGSSWKPRNYWSFCFLILDIWYISGVYQFYSQQ